MGVKNFTLLLEASGYVPSTRVSRFDSILIDIQSLLYAKLDSSFKYCETDIVEEVCVEVVKAISEKLQFLFGFRKHSDHVKVIIGFDGQSVPMKWPLQRERRATLPQEYLLKHQLKDSLFENNVISQKVFERLIQVITLERLQFDHRPEHLTFYLSDSSISGEGEHKVFHIARKTHSKHPIVVSVDNDVFLIALARLDQFSSIQIDKGKDIYNMNHFVTDYMKCQPQAFLRASFLFGNDFIPEIIGLDRYNVCALWDIIKAGSNIASLPNYLQYIVTEMWERKKIRFSEEERIDPGLAKEFYKNCFWVLDYYTKYKFPQKYLENIFYTTYDRNRILTALIRCPGMPYESALKEYVESKPPKRPTPQQEIFPELKWQRIKPYLLEPSSDESIPYIQW